MSKIKILTFTDSFRNLKNNIFRNIKCQRKLDIREDFNGSFKNSIKKIKKNTNGDETLKAIRETFMLLEGNDKEKWKWEEKQIYFFELIMLVIAKWIYGKELEENTINIMQRNGWLKLSQFLNIVAPRRIGKTTLVGATCAAILLNIPNVLISVYSLCQRTSIDMGEKIKSFINRYEIINPSRHSQFKIGKNNGELFRLHNKNDNFDVRTLKCYPASDKVLFII